MAGLQEAMARQSYNSRIRARIAELEREIATRQSELDELKIAERVIDRFGADEYDAAGDDTERGITIADLIVKVLIEHGAMETAAVHQYMQDAYNRVTTLNTVGSTLSRLKSDGRVTLDGRFWSALRGTVKKETNKESSPGETDLLG